MNKSRLVIAILLVLGACTSGSGQEARTLEQKITDAVKIHRPGWRLETVAPAAHAVEMDFDVMHFLWVTEERAGVSAWIWSHSSAGGAAARYEELIAAPPKPGRRRRAGSEERSGGDSYIWAEESTWPGARRVETFFRLSKKGKTVLLVIGFTPEDASSFSALIATELPAT